jgi:hypothetical protein
MQVALMSRSALVYIVVVNHHSLIGWLPPRANDWGRRGFLDGAPTASAKDGRIVSNRYYDRKAGASFEQDHAGVANGRD